ncbi:MAG: hypothetical protein IPP40_12120 [bacterium]|nr:hypothetical protein [bacterium]
MDTVDLYAYTYAPLSASNYSNMFREELSTPGPRIPITKDKKLFAEVAAQGRNLIWLHTYAERFVPKGKNRGKVPKGRAKCLQGVPEGEDDYPDKYYYDQAGQTLHINGGRFAPVSKEVFEFSVSGLKVVQSWLNYRMKKGAGKKSSELDKIRPTNWTNELTTELPELLWVLEATIEKQPSFHAF